RMAVSTHRRRGRFTERGPDGHGRVEGGSGGRALYGTPSPPRSSGAGAVTLRTSLAFGRAAGAFRGGTATRTGSLGLHYGKTYNRGIAGGNFQPFLHR